MALNRIKKEASTARWILLAIVITLLSGVFSLALQAPTTAYAASSGSIAVFDSADGSLKFYNSTTASTYVATSTQTIYSGFDQPTYTLSDITPWKSVKASITSVEVVDSGIQPTYTNFWFSDCPSLESVDLSRLDVSECNAFRYMFSGCSSLTSVSTLTGWTIKTSGTHPDFEYMFSGCSSLVDISPIGTWDTSHVEDFKGMFQGCTSLEVVDLGGWDMSSAFSGILGINRLPSLADSYKLRRLTVSSNVKLANSPLAEHPIRGTTDQNWELENGDGTPVATTDLAALINNGQGAGTWVWHTMTSAEFNNSARIEERIYDAIDESYKTVSDGFADQNLTHRIAATFPSVISSYSSFPITIEDWLTGIELSSINDISVDIDGTDITNEVKSGYGSITYANGKLTVTIGDAKSGFGKGVTVNSQSILNVYYQAHTTATSTLGSTGNPTNAKMSYPSPPNRATIESSETTVTTTLTGSYTTTIAKVDRTTRSAVQGATLSVYSQNYSKYVQADGSLSDSPYAFTTGQDGTISIPHIGRGTLVIHETQPPANYDAMGDVSLIISPAYTYDPASITSLLASATGDNISQPASGQQTVGNDQDGITSIDTATGTVIIRVSDPQTQQNPDPGNDPGNDPNPGPTTPTTYIIEVLKVDKATRQPVEHAGYKVATTQNGLTRYLKSDGSLTADPAEAGIFETGNDGTFEITGLNAGAYTFHEATHPNHYSTDAPDFTVTISATRDAITNELTALTAAYSGGYTSINHSGSGYAATGEDGILSTSVSTGKVEVRSSMLYVLFMPRAGMEKSKAQAVLITLAFNYLLSVALFAARKAVLEAEAKGIIRC